MDKSSLGDRMKSYEKTFSHNYPIRMPLILRFDGVHFHSMVKRWKCDKPFDDRLIAAMQYTALTLCKTIPGAQVAYVQSDEITLLIRDDMTNQSQPVFDKKINKMMSVFAARASNAFNFAFFDETLSSVAHEHLAEFDCRGYVVPEQEIINSFIWRQQDATRNAIQMLARSYFSHKQLHKKSCDEIQEMLFSEHHINYNDTSTHLKRGSCIIKTNKEVPVKKWDSGKLIASGEMTTRSSWSVDVEIPIFTKDRTYIEQFAKVVNYE
jgi:tRNA(His) 5'-end guanylyltransferase